jgi:hypothetical protein
VSKFDQLLSSRKAASKTIVDPVVRRSRADSRVALYQAFADDERANDARTEQSPLVQWARRRSVAEAPSVLRPDRSRRGARLAHID